MPDIGTWLIQHWDSGEHAIAEHVPHRGGSREHPYPDDTQAPAETPVTLAAAPAIPEGEHMALTADDLRELAGHLDKIGEDGLVKAEQLGSEVLTKAQAVVASPACAEGFGLLHVLTGINVDPAIITQALGGLRAIVAAYAPVQAAGAQQAPAPEAPAEPEPVPAA